MKYKKIILPFLFIFVLCACLVGCAKETTEELSFTSQPKPLKETETPDNLPSKIIDYLKWDRTEATAKIAETENAQIFADKNNTSELYIKWLDGYYALPWKDARERELDIQAFEYDFDGDSQNEIAVNIIGKGGTNWQKDELHIIDSINGPVCEAGFPREELESRIKSGIKLESNKITFSDLSVEIPAEKISENTKLYDDLSYVTFSLDKTLGVKVSVDTAELIQLAELSASLAYKDGVFTLESPVLAEIQY